MGNRLLIAFVLFISFSDFLLKASAEEMQHFIVTAYYSPLPNQEYYLKWNYEDEIKLNWRWIRGASWLDVFDWMIAWPSKYPFWTKIFLEWIWTWIVADRWWAIVEAWERWYDVDRLDVWMWYGDEWLKRALSWGKRKVSWKIIEMWTSKVASTSNVWVSYTSSITNFSSNNDEIYRINVWPDSSSAKLKKLQAKLKETWIYNWEINGIYNNELKNSLIKFQIDNWILKSKLDYGAWYWGAKTREKLASKEKELVSKNTKIVKTENKVDNKQKETISVPKDIFTTYVSPESNKDDVKSLQAKLKELALYNWEINWKYSDIQTIVLNYQLNKNIIKSKGETWAWYFGPKTRESLKKDYSSFLVKKENEERDRRKLEEVKTLALNEAKKHIDKIWNPKVWETSQNVRELQKTLITLWYFDWKDTAIYWEKTKESVLNFQIDKKLVFKATDPWAWKIWEKTKEEIKKELAKLITEKRIKEAKTVAMNYKK